jgi:hypothetical protein
METNNYVIGDRTKKILDCYKLLNDFWDNFSEAITKTYGSRDADTFFEKLDLEMKNVEEMLGEILALNVSDNFVETADKTTIEI